MGFSLDVSKFPWYHKLWIIPAMLIYLALCVVVYVIFIPFAPVLYLFHKAKRRRKD